MGEKKALKEYKEDPDGFRSEVISRLRNKELKFIG